MILEIAEIVGEGLVSVRSVLVDVLGVEVAAAANEGVEAPDVGVGEEIYPALLRALDVPTQIINGV